MMLLFICALVRSSQVGFKFAQSGKQRPRNRGTQRGKQGKNEERLRQEDGKQGAGNSFWRSQLGSNFDQHGL
eukprot:568088-Karenia_brevis.AAC.1